MIAYWSVGLRTGAMYDFVSPLHQMKYGHRNIHSISTRMSHHIFANKEWGKKAGG